MKQLLIMLCGLLCWCGCRQANDGFVVSGTLENAPDGGIVMLQSRATGEMIADTAVIADGKFRLEGKLGRPQLCMLLIDFNKAGEATDYDKMYGTELYVEDKAMTYTADLEQLPSYGENFARTGKPVITGSEVQKLYEKYRETVSNITDDAARQEATRQFIRENSASIVAFDLMNDLFAELPVPYTAAQIDEMLGWLQPAWSTSPDWPTLADAAAKAMKSAVGEKFIDAEFLTPEGERVKLSSLIEPGRYTMVEFWASWCAPCRGEIPHLKEVYKRYKDFRIVSISVDQREEDWKKAMEEEGMEWTQLRNPEGFGGVVQAEYGIMAIPACLILDKEGRFYKTNMRGDNLDDFLRTTYDGDAKP